VRTPQRRGGASGDHQPPAVATRPGPARSGPTSPRNSGEEGGLPACGGHLRLPDLPALQVPPAGPPGRQGDERVHGAHDGRWPLAEDLLTHDELAGLWQARPVTLVGAQIGTKSGTGGSTGAPYLRARVPVHYYPLLWELRDFL